MDNSGKVLQRAGMGMIFTSTKYIVFLSSAVFFVIASAAGTRAETSPEDAVEPTTLYGAGIDFDVYREGKKVGYHKVRFDRDEKDLLVSSEFHLKIRVFFLTAFEYLYEAEGRWRDGHLLRLEALVNDNGTQTSLAAERSGDTVAVRNANGTVTSQAPIYPTNHWNVSVLSERRVLNTLTGKINTVEIERRGRERVATEAGEVSATRYAYTGDLDAEVWYDDAGRWVKLRFAARDGSAIDYVCRRCQGGPQVEARND
jgi:hypothetical protein